MLLDDAPRRETDPARLVGQLIKDYAADRPGIKDEVADWFDSLDVTKVYRQPVRGMSKGGCY